MKSKLDSAFCIPENYQIMKIYDDVDLDSDRLSDKIIRWQKIKLADGDTIFYSIYTKHADGKLTLRKTLRNLEPYYFNNYGSHSGNKFYDSIKSIYSYPTTSEVEFKTNSINLTFYTDAATIKKLFFTYSLIHATWILSREIQWFAPTQYEDDRKLEYDRPPGVSMQIEEFDMLKYIGW